MRWATALALGAFVSLALGAPAAAQRLDQIFERGNQHYFAGDYQAAVNDYELLVQAGVDDPDVSFNLATAHGRLGRYGHAIRWFERALVLRPNDAGAEQGLSEAREALSRRQSRAHADAELESEPTFAESLVRPFSESTLAWVVLVVNLLLFGLLVAFRRVRAESGRLALGITIPLVGILWLASGAGLASKAGLLRPGDPAIVLVAEAQLREGPDPRAEARGSVLEGERARVVQTDGEWSRIRVGSRDGWVRGSDVGAL